jgi:large subunit ribosomal protein L4
MLTLNVYNRQGETVGTVEVDPAEFGGKINRQLLHEVVLMYLANQRAGTHSTLRRGEVAGSTKKLFRQKGTGNARVGTRRTNKRRGGGTAKGPKPRDYEYHLPKKAVKAATRMAILSKLQDNETVVIDDLSVPEIKTRPVAAILEALKLADTTCLIGTATPPQVAPDETDEQKKAAAESARQGHQRLYLSARNLEGVEILPASQLNAYTVLRQKRLLLTRAALEELRQAGKPPAEPAPAPPPAPAQEPTQSQTPAQA